jgi:hypothetical protein
VNNALSSLLYIDGVKNLPYWFHNLNPNLVPVPAWISEHLFLVNNIYRLVTMVY